MSEEYEDFPPGDEDAEDFRNFDPSRYTRRRNQSSDVGNSAEQSGSSDFDNFDPSKYIRKRRTSYAPDANDEAEGGRRGRRAGRSSAYASYEEPQRERAGGMGALAATLLGLFSSGELFTTPAWRTIRPFVTLIGCAILIGIGAICAVGFWLAQSLGAR
jgi:hypothetical protein